MSPTVLDKLCQNPLVSSTTLKGLYAEAFLTSSKDTIHTHSISDVMSKTTGDTLDLQKTRGKSTLMLGEVKVASQGLEDSVGYQDELPPTLCCSQSRPHITQKSPILKSLPQVPASYAVTVTDHLSSWGSLYQPS